MPALPLDDAGPYVAGAYVVFVAMLLIYVAIMATKIQRINRDLDELTDLAEEKARAGDGVADRASDPAAPPASQPAGTGREAEDSGGGVPENRGGGVLPRAGPAATSGPEPDGPGRGAPQPRSGGAGGGVSHG